MSHRRQRRPPLPLWAQLIQILLATAVLIWVGFEAVKGLVLR